MSSQNFMSPQETLVSQALRLAEEGSQCFHAKATRHLPADRVFMPRQQTLLHQRLFSRTDAELIGLPTGKASGLLVIDIDNKNGKNGFVWPALNELPPTRLVATVNGGRHYYFKMPDAA